MLNSAEAITHARFDSLEYFHEPSVVAQSSECLKLPATKLLTALESGHLNGQKIKEETLVQLAREFRRRGKDTLAWKITTVLVQRVQPSLLRAIKLWRFSPVVAEEFVESMVTSLYEAIMNEDESERFWEIRFWVCFDRRLLTALKKHRLHSDRNKEASTMDSDYEDLQRHVRDLGSDFTNPSLRAIIAEGLSQLPENLRTAFMLKHWAGFPEHSADKSDPATIASIMGVSDRTVRNYLLRAEVLLNNWRRDSAMSHKDKELAT